MQIKCRKNNEIRKSYFGNLHSKNILRKELSMDTEMSRETIIEERNIYIISKHLPLKYLIITKSKNFTIELLGRYHFK